MALVLGFVSASGKVDNQSEVHFFEDEREGLSFSTLMNWPHLVVRVPPDRWHRLDLGAGRGRETGLAVGFVNAEGSLTNLSEVHFFEHNGEGFTFCYDNRARRQVWLDVPPERWHPADDPGLKFFADMVDSRMCDDPHQMGPTGPYDSNFGGT